MKKIINGRRYDTATAKLIGECENGYQSDFRWYHEELYQKTTGEFFLYGEGNGLSAWASHTFDGYTYGEDIRPLSLDETKKWVEDNLSADTYEELFAIPDEGTGKQIQSYSLSQKAIAGLTKLAQTFQTSRSDIIEQLVSKALKESQNA